jgi:class 3 adenylate cyclase/pimeloyl-ACP methyl ester carboxylesterase
MSGLPETRITHSADGTALAYQVYGQGALDLVTLGGGYSPYELMWDDPGFLRMAKRLGKFSRTIYLNPRGWGASEGDPRSIYSGQFSRDDLVAVLDAAGAKQAALMAWSATGARAIDFAAMHPERVRAIVLIDGFAHYVREEDYPWGMPRESLDRAVAYLEEAWATAVDLDITAPSRMADERFRTWWGRHRRAGVGPNAYAAAFRASLEQDVRELLPSIAAPTLVLHREGDRFIHLGAGRYLAEHIPNAKLVVLPGEDHIFFVGDTDAIVDEIEEFLTGYRSEAEGQVRTVTVLFTDIVASTEHQARVGPREWSRLTEQHDTIVRDRLSGHSGRAVKTTGDGFLATFDSIGGALRCAGEILANAKGIGLDLRAGLHTGDVEVRDDDIAGLPVTIAKRVCDLAAPGEVLVTEIVRGLMMGSGFGFMERGERDLKGVPGSWRLYRVVS